MPPSTLIKSLSSRQQYQQILTTRPQSNSKQCFYDQRQFSSHALTSRTHRYNAYQLSKTSKAPLSYRTKQNDPPIINKFSASIHPNPSKNNFAKRPPFSQQKFSTDNNFNFQRTCRTQFSPSNQSHRDSSKSSSSKRKKKTPHLFNFPAKSSKLRQKTSEEMYIKSFLQNNKSQFITTNYSQTDCKKIDKYQNTNRNDQSDKEKNVNKGFVLKQTNYEKIRQKMNILKNMTEARQFRRKPLKYKTTQQEWNEIERVVRMVCRQEIKRVDTQETTQTKMQPSKDQIDEDYEKMTLQNHEAQNPKEFEQLNQLTDVKTALQISHKFINDEPINNAAELANTEHKDQSIAEHKDQSVNDPRLHTAQSKEPTQTKPQHENSLNPKFNSFKSIDPQKVSQTDNFPPKNPSSLQFRQFSSLLLIYEHTLYIIPSIISKVSEICQSYQLQYKLPIFLFFKHMCLHKKFIESIFNQQQDSFFKQFGVYDYSNVVSQIRKANAKNIQILSQLRPDFSVKPDKIAHEQSLSLLTGKQSILLLHKKINAMKKDFTSFNMKLIKKLLKKLSKSQTTNTKEFHVFLNYCGIFLNLSLVYQNIEKVLLSKIKIQQPENRKSCQQKEQERINNFLYVDCGFVENKYLSMKEKVFEMCFDIEEEHKKIEKHYHELIKEFKIREEGLKGKK